MSKRSKFADEVEILALAQGIAFKYKAEVKDAPEEMSVSIQVMGDQKLEVLNDLPSEFTYQESKDGLRLMYIGEEKLNLTAEDAFNAEGNLYITLQEDNRREYIKIGAGSIVFVSDGEIEMVSKDALFKQQTGHEM